MRIMNADDHERHGRPDVHDRVFLNWQREHARENGHARARGYGQSQSRGHADGCAGADVRGSCSWCLQYLEVLVGPSDQNISLWPAIVQTDPLPEPSLYQLAAILRRGKCLRRVTICRTRLTVLEPRHKGDVIMRQMLIGFALALTQDLDSNSSCL